MKGENRDINAVERINIPKFSMLDDLVTPLKFLELFVYDTLNNIIVGYTKLLSHREKEETNLEVTNVKKCLFLSMLLLSGCHKFADRKMYWEKTTDTFA